MLGYIIKIGVLVCSFERSIEHNAIKESTNKHTHMKSVLINIFVLPFKGGMCLNGLNKKKKTDVPIDIIIYK